MRRGSVIAILAILAVLFWIGAADTSRAEDPSARGGNAGATQPPARQRLVPRRATLLDARFHDGGSEPVADMRFRSLASGVYLSGVGDYLTTQRFRDQGIREANPLLASVADSPVGLAVVKLGGGTLINYIAYNLKKDGKRYWSAPQIVWIALNVAVVFHNSNAAD